MAQFSSVEQLVNLGTKLDNQAAGTDAMLGVINNTAAVGLIGREAMVMDDLVAAGPNGTERAEVMVPSSGGVGTLRVTDLEGNTLRTIPLGYMAGGERSLDVADALDGLPEGSYRIAVDFESEGETTPLATQVAIRVDGVRLSAEGA